MDEPTKKARKRELDQAHERIKQHELDSLVVDFDADLESYLKIAVPHFIKFGGKKYRVPATAPSDFTMFYLRNCLTEQADGTLLFRCPDPLFPEMLSLMLGSEAASDILSSKTEVGFLFAVVVPRLFQLWGLTYTPKLEAAEQGEPEPIRG